ncbi:MAG: hypothetical protein E6K94_03525 [Thaumarchaeota archaeon]|nr:MAG: hypothetical protein E6K94_03525 [Nitrososphaerota archaeon]
MILFLANHFHNSYVVEKIMIFSIFIVSVYIIWSVLSIDSFALQYSSLVVLSNDTVDSINPQFSTSQDRIYASWISNVNSQNSDVMFKKSDNDGKSFSKPINLSNSSGISNIIKLRNSKNNVYITWEDKQSDQWKLLFRKSQDYGKKFSNVLNISRGTGNVHLHDLSAEGKNVYVVWAANENISSKIKEVYFRKSSNYGDSFGDTVNLSNTDDDSLDPHITTSHDGSTIYIVWTECDIKEDDPICRIAFTKSLDKGNTFTIPKNVSDTTQFLKRKTSYHTQDSESKSNNPQSYPIKSTTGEKENYSINPSVFTTFDGKIVYVLWEEDLLSTGRTEVFLGVSNDYGKSFSSTINVSNTSGVSRLAQGQLVDEDLYVVWSDTLDQYDKFNVMLKKVSSKNLSGKAINLSNNSGNSVSPSLLIKDDRIFTAWTDESNTSSIGLWSGHVTGLSGINTKLNGNSEAIPTNPVIFDTNDKAWIGWTENNNSRNKILLIAPEKMKSD